MDRWSILLGKKFPETKEMLDTIKKNTVGRKLAAKMIHRELHECRGILPKHSDLNCPETIHYCIEDNQHRLWVISKGGVAQVNYCPYCGCKAMVQVDKKDIGKL